MLVLSIFHFTTSLQDTCEGTRPIQYGDTRPDTAHYLRTANDARISTERTGSCNCQHPSEANPYATHEMTALPSHPPPSSEFDRDSLKRRRGAFEAESSESASHADTFSSSVASPSGHRTNEAALPSSRASHQTSAPSPSHAASLARIANRSEENPISSWPQDDICAVTTSKYRIAADNLHDAGKYTRLTVYDLIRLTILQSHITVIHRPPA